MGLVPYIHYYLSYPISTTITFQKHPVSEFPAVTVCGQSRINCENAQNAAGNCQNGDSDECKLTSAQSIEVVQVILEHFCPSSNNSRKKREENHDEEKIPTSGNKCKIYYSASRIFWPLKRVWTIIRANLMHIGLLIFEKTGQLSGMAF